MASTATKFDTDCKLMLHMDGSDASTTFTDSSLSARSVTANGDAQIDTARSKFGGASGLFDGTGDYLSVSNNSDFDFGSGDWTIDFWAYITGSVQAYGVYSFHSGGSGWGFLLATPANAGAGYIGVYNDAATQFQIANTNTALTQNTWQHIALVASSGKLYFFIDGVLQNPGGTSFTGTFNTSSHDLRIGDFNAAGYLWTGSLDELRVVKGTAIWTSNFTPPSSAYSRRVAGNQVIWVD